MLSGFGPGHGAQNDERARARQLLVAKDVRNDQRLKDHLSPMWDCQNCGAKGGKTHDKDTCPARNRECFNCGIRGHYGRMCRELKNSHLLREKQLAARTRKAVAERVPMVWYKDTFP